MATRACPQCGEQIQRVAKICRFCRQGVQPLSRFSTIETIGVGLGVFFGGLFLVALVSGPSTEKPAGFPQAAGTPSSAAPTAPAAPAVHRIGIGAPVLSKEYNANEVAADDKYKGQALLVVGYVTGIEKGIMGGPIVKLKGSGYSNDVWCHFPDDTKGLGSLNKGDQFAAYGQGAGMVMGSPQVDDCSVPSDAMLKADFPEQTKGTARKKHKQVAEDDSD